jgi:hypothetical protein
MLSTSFEQSGHNVALDSDTNILPQEAHLTFWFSYMLVYCKILLLKLVDLKKGNFISIEMVI